MNYETSAPFIRVLGRALQARSCVVLAVLCCHSGGCRGVVNLSVLPADAMLVMDNSSNRKRACRRSQRRSALRLENEVVMDGIRETLLLLLLEDPFQDPRKDPERKATGC